MVQTIVKPHMSRSASPRPRNTVVRIIVIFAILAGGGWGGRFVWKQVSPTLFGQKRPEQIRTDRVRTANISEEIVAVGRVRAVFSTELRAEINGRIMKILAKDGQTVARNEEIVRLDQQDLLTQITEMERTIEATKLRSLRTRRDYERTAELHRTGLITTKEFEDAKINLSLAENDSAIADARLANLRDKLAKTVIRAPHDGTLLLRDLTEGQVITGAAAQNGGTILGEVADLSVLMVRTNVNEIDVARIKSDDVARVRVDPLRNVMMSGAVRRIATSATETQVDRTRLFPVDVHIENVDPRLRPGMSATVIFTLAQVRNTPAVLLSAVFTTADSMRYVFVRQAGTFHIRPVEVGIADTRRIQILSGLQLGDEVATSRPLEFEGEVPVAPPAMPPVAARRKGT